MRVIKRGVEYPFHSVSDFFFKLFVTLGLSFPIYLILSIIGGIIVGLIVRQVRQRTE